MTIKNCRSACTLRAIYIVISSAILTLIVQVAALGGNTKLVAGKINTSYVLHRNHELLLHARFSHSADIRLYSSKELCIYM